MLVLALAAFVALGDARRRRRRDRNDWDFGYERDIVKSPYKTYNARYYRKTQLEKAERKRIATQRFYEAAEREIQRQIDEMVGRKRP